MPFKNIFFPKPQKISPESFPTAMSVHDSINKKPTAVEKTAAPPRQKPAHTPIYDSTKKLDVKDAAAPARPQKKPIHPHRKSIGTKSRAAVDGRRVTLLHNEERTSARKLRKIKRSLFLEAVNAEQPSIGIEGSDAVTCTVDVVRVALLQNEQEWISVRELRKTKRRLFLEAVNSEQPSIGTKGSAAATGTVRIKSPRNVVRQELSGKKTRTGKE